MRCGTATISGLLDRALHCDNSMSCVNDVTHIQNRCALCEHEIDLAFKERKMRVHSLAKSLLENNIFRETETA